MLKFPKDFFAKPTTFAYAGLWAMVPKFLLTSGIVLIVGPLITEDALRLSMITLAYPIIGLIIDIFLYIFRDRIWQNLPDTSLISEDWQITAEQLQAYAKNLPKTRFFRIIFSIVLLPVLTDKWTIDWIATTFGSAFFFTTIFDRFWLNFFKIQAPKISTARQTSNLFDKSGQDMSKQMDVTIPGSTAWFSMQNINSMGTKIDPWK